ncbi:MULTISPECIES: hypothetical protein [Paenibacillus]|uniref:Uncharacterized protein n=1 Tax=Paenibacillus taichungensis TaxID=484184 RepID=A0ABX2MFE9_9BACL|nr:MULTISPECIES: hypothetical protein [Paenibacillus]MDR9748931.1 hypothetical protein [Paenibacillus taichungensis]NUU53645.1 hypothetical protein [Paenibacillus taichungensis]
MTIDACPVYDDCPGGRIPPGYLYRRKSGHARAGGCGGQTPILRLAGHPSMMHLTPGHIL